MARYTSQNAYVVADVQVDPRGVDLMFATLGYNLSDPALATFLEDEVDPYVRRRVLGRFAGEGDDVTGAWLPLAPATNAIRAAAGFPPAHPINQRTHMMRNWLVGQQGDVKVGGVGAELTYPGPASTGLLGQKIKTAQMGKTYPRTPPRPVLGLNQVDNLFVQSELVQFLLSGF